MQLNTKLQLMVIGIFIVFGLWIGYNVFDVFGAETQNIVPIYDNNNVSGTDIHEYILEIKFETCHSIFNIYNLSDYYRCIDQ